MTDLFSKILGIVLAFILLAFAPLTINALTSDLTMKRASINEVTNFINKVTDTGKISDAELADFYLGCTSHGATADIKIKRYVMVVNPDGAGGTYTSYVISEDISNWNKGDVIQITFKAIDWTGAQRILFQLIKIAQSKFEFTLAGKVR
jgi:hypothetical protein